MTSWKAALATALTAGLTAGTPPLAAHALPQPASGRINGTLIVGIWNGGAQRDAEHDPQVFGGAAGLSTHWVGIPTA